MVSRQNTGLITLLWLDVASSLWQKIIQHRPSFNDPCAGFIPTKAIHGIYPVTARRIRHSFGAWSLCRIPLLMPENFYFIVWKSAAAPWARSVQVRTCRHPESAQWDSAFKFNFLVAKNCVFIWRQVEKGGQVGFPWSNFSFHVYELHPCLWWAEARTTAGGSF